MTKFETRWSQLDRLRGTQSTEAWQWFVDRYCGFVEAALRRLIWSPERAAAAAEEFWGYLFESRAVERLNRTQRFRAFLSGVLHNYAADWRRRNRSAVPASGVAAVPDQGSLPEDDELALFAQQVLHLSLSRLARLQPLFAESLRRFYGLASTADGQKVPRQRATEIAAQLGLAPNALHQTLVRARKQLRVCLADELRNTVKTSEDLADEVALMLGALDRATPGILAAHPTQEQE